MVGMASAGLAALFALPTRIGAGPMHAIQPFLAFELSPDWWKYATIPVIAGIIGYGTNWVAVKMTFLPLEFIGIPPYLGWQGIIPSKARKMASIAVESTMSKLGSLSEIVEQMDPERIAERVIETADPLVEEMTAEIAERQNPELWRNLPDPMKRAIYDRVRRKLPVAVDGLMQDVGEQIEHLLDMRMMVIELMADDKDLTNRMFLEAGEAEFRFIVNSGLYFGFALGLVQMGVQIVFDAWWVLPIAGILVGYITNWLALNLIFRPVEPKRIGPFVAHGLFLRRQAEVASVFTRLVTREILTLRNFVDAMLNGPRADRTHALVRKHVRPIVDEALGIAGPAVRLAVGSREYDSIKDSLETRAIEHAPRAFDDPVFNAERAVVVEQVMRERMLELSSSEFQELLRPAFQEDEIKLILVGAALGGLAGLAQSVLVFGA